MTDTDIRSLKAYLTNVLEPGLKFNRDRLAEQTEAAKVAFHAGSAHDRIQANNMRQYHTGKMQAYEAAISEFKEMFAEELGGEAND